jgi:hypothetical protein
MAIVKFFAVKMSSAGGVELSHQQVRVKQEDNKRNFDQRPREGIMLFATFRVFGHASWYLF